MGPQRKKFMWALVSYYRIRDFDYDYITYFPFYSEKTAKNAKDWNILYLMYGGRQKNEENPKNTLLITPLNYYRRKDIAYEAESKTNRAKEVRWWFPIVPLFY